MSDFDERAASARLEYDGTLGELYRIFLVNLLLTIVTFGIYRFWATTRTRRYVWSHTRYMGDRFEYLGTGGEKFRGFVLAMLVLLALAAVNNGLEVVGRSTGVDAVRLLQIPVGLLYVVLYGTAVYAAQRYRLSRSSWRGIRGGMQPGALVFGVRTMLYVVQALFTLGLTWPSSRGKLLQHRIEASSFGSAPMAVSLRGGKLLGLYVLTLLCVAGLLGIVAFCAVLIGSLGHATAGFGAFSIWHWIIVLAVVLALFGGGRALLSWVDAALARQVVTTLRYADLRFATTISGGALFRLRFGNAMIWLFTLGLGSPIVTQRGARFIARRVQVLGRLDAAALRQTTVSAPRQGEGLMEALDVGIAG